MRTQAEFLAAHGIEDLVAEGSRLWERDGIQGGLDALAGRSARSEAAALCDPAGLGGFAVVEWAR